MRKTNFRLWTPICDAWMIYRRRYLREPGAHYEHIWRLIHVNEAVTVFLGSVFASRLLDIFNKPERAEDLKKLTTKITGDRTDPDLKAQNNACLSGSVGAWIDLLNTFVDNDYDCPFLASLKEYLKADIKGELAFLTAWGRIAPVPNEFKQSEMNRIRRMYAINTMRNKIAHLPISERILEDLHLGLRRETVALLTPECSILDKNPKADINTFNWHETLKGKIGVNSVSVTGAEPSQIELNVGEEPCVIPEVGSDTDLYWKVSPFVRIDNELKVLLLFKVNGDFSDLKDVEGEYHRFAAEFDPVQLHDIKPDNCKRLVYVDAAPKDKAKIEAKVVAIEDDGVSLRTKAENAFRDKDYEAAAKYFELLAKSKESFRYTDVAKSKHGAALWRMASFSGLTAAEVKEIIGKSIQLLTEALRHKDIDYRAITHYELSKAQFHMWELTKDAELFQETLLNAKRATELTFNPVYTSWNERLLRVAEDL